MSGKVVNLRAARKARARSKDRSRADANAAKHGRTKAERAAEDDRQTRLNRHLDGHKKEDEA